jgi:hypothetical protein
MPWPPICVERAWHRCHFYALMALRNGIGVFKVLGVFRLLDGLQSSIAGLINVRDERNGYGKDHESSR